MEPNQQNVALTKKPFSNAPSLRKLLAEARAKREAEKAAQQTQPPAQGK